MNDFEFTTIHFIGQNENTPADKLMVRVNNNQRTVLYDYINPDLVQAGLCLRILQM